MQVTPFYGNSLYKIGCRSWAHSTAQANLRAVLNDVSMKLASENRSLILKSSMHSVLVQVIL